MSSARVMLLGALVLLMPLGSMGIQGFAADGGAIAQGGRGLHADVAIEGTQPATETVWLELPGILDAAATQSSITVQLGDSEVTLEVREIEMRAPDWTASITRDDGSEETVSVASLGTFEGRRPGSPVWDSSVTMVPGFFQAAIAIDACTERVVSMASPVTVDEAGRVRVDTYELRCDDVAVQAPPLDAPAHPAATDGGGDARGHEENDPGELGLGQPDDWTGIPYEQLGLEALNGWGPPATTLSLRIALDADKRYGDENGYNWATAQAAVLNDLQQKIYEPQLMLEFHIVEQHLHGGSTSPVVSDPQSVLGEVQNWWWRNRAFTARDAVLFLYERVLADGYDGIAWQPGIDDPGRYAYAVVQTIDRDSTAEYRLAAHEIGHVFNGDHGYARRWREWQCAWTCVKGTIMANGILLQNTIDKFTAGDGDEFNAWRIRWCAENKADCPDLPTTGQ